MKTQVIMEAVNQSTATRAEAQAQAEFTLVSDMQWRRS